MAAPAPKPGPPAAGAPAPGGAAGGAEPEKKERPLGPDGKPIPGPEQMRQIQAARKMGQQQAQVEEVIGIMHKNVENVLERDAKLGDLEERADALQDGCKQFEQQAAAMKNKFWLENMKAIVAGCVVAVIVGGLVYWKFFMAPPPPAYPPGYPPPPPPPAPAAPAADAGADAGGDGGGDDGGSSEFVSLGFAKWF